MLITDQYLKCTYYVLLLILRPYNLNTLDIQPYNNLLDKGKSFIFFLNAENFSTPLGQAQERLYFGPRMLKIKTTLDLLKFLRLFSLQMREFFTVTQGEMTEPKHCRVCGVAQ